MKKQEKELFLDICNFMNDKQRHCIPELIKYSTASVLGYIFLNRMQGIAYDVLKNDNLLGKVNREFREVLRTSYEQNVRRNISFEKAVCYLYDIFSEFSEKYAMLKGAFLFKKYPEGYRTANDIDLLVLPENITQIGKILMDNGFLQGKLVNGKFIPANRYEVIESRMNRGETVPYIKEINLPFMKYLEVDINFSLDYKNSNDSVVKKMLESSENITVNELALKTLSFEDFFLHLCCHLYKEASTFSWIEMKRDMTLYKYCDIYMLLYDISESETDKLFDRAIDFELEKVCSYAILQTDKLFKIKNRYAVKRAKFILAKDNNFLHTVILPKENKKFIYTEKDIKKRFFSENRIQFLTEAENEKIKNEKK